jgi:hypothetical protein
LISTLFKKSEEKHCIAGALPMEKRHDTTFGTSVACFKTTIIPEKNIFDQCNDYGTIVVRRI